MNDYIIDEKLLKEFRDVTAPIPYPEKPDKDRGKKNPTPPNFASMQISSNAANKKELSDLEAKFKNLEKAYNKLLKKHTDISEEYKSVKLSNEALTKELNIIQITNEKIIGEKLSIESQLEENKNYTRKIESRLVSGAKNQYLVEINNKLRKEIEDSRIKFNEGQADVEKYKNEINKNNQEIIILNKALEIRIDDLKIKGDVKSSLLYDVGMVKQEMDDCKEKLNKIKEENLKLKRELEEKVSKIQEINFAKAHLTELLVEKENQVHNLEVEKESFQMHCSSIIEERNVLRDYIEKLNLEFKELDQEVQNEKTTLMTRIKELDDSLRVANDLNKKFSIENESLKTSLNNSQEKIKTLDSNFKQKITECIELDGNDKELRKKIEFQEEKILELTAANQKFQESVTDLNKQIHSHEKENIELMKKNKNLLISQEGFQTDLVKQNQHLQNCENKLKEQIQKNLSEIDKLKEERESLKKIMNEAVSNCTNLIKDKTELEKEINRKNIQIENLKNANALLHKNFANAIESAEKNPQRSENEDQGIIKIGEMKIEENNMIALIRREKEKNKEFLEEIKKLKSNI